MHRPVARRACPFQVSDLWLARQLLRLTRPVARKSPNRYRRTRHGRRRARDIKPPDVVTNLATIDPLDNRDHRQWRPVSPMRSVDACISPDRTISAFRRSPRRPFVAFGWQTGIVYVCEECDVRIAARPDFDIADEDHRALTVWAGDCACTGVIWRATHRRGPWYRESEH